VKLFHLVGDRFDKSLLRKVATESEEPITHLLLKVLDRISEQCNRSITLLAVNPNSLSVIKSALRSAKKYNSPIILTCTLNQVDLDGGYTTWTQSDFVKVVKEEAETIDFDGPIIIAADHYGPWLKDKHTKEGLSLEDTIAGVKDSLEACLQAGFDYIHVDATMCPELSGASRMSKVAERTLELIEHTETLRKEKGLPKISYEVGTEEVAGGLAEPDLVSMFLGKLKEMMLARGLIGAWPSFLVGNIGTALDTTTFDFEAARTLFGISSGYGLHLKSHYTDYVARLEDYPKIPIRGANVGPRFANAEFDSLQRLADTEAEFSRTGIIGQHSDLSQVLVKAVVDSDRWKKWLHKSEVGKDFSQIDRDRQLWLLRTGARYVWMSPSVVAGRTKLYDNLRTCGINAEEEVLGDIDKAMDAFFVPFNLEDSSSKIESVLKDYADSPRGAAR
jgi:tagatose-1,6-bisphosphate aldolase non-catalytic subunit AgaZ/GatZ